MNNRALLLAFVLVLTYSWAATAKDSLLHRAGLSNAEYQGWIKHLDLFDTPGLMPANVQRIHAIKYWAEAHQKQHPELSTAHKMHLFKLDMASQANYVTRQLREQYTYPPTNAEAYLQQNSDAYDKPERRRISQIFLAYPDNASPHQKQGVQDQLKKLVATINSLEDFKQVAFTHSQSQTKWSHGNLGLIAKGSLSGIVGETIDQLAADQLSPVIDADIGAMVFYCSKVVPAVTLSLAQKRNKAQKSVLKQAWEGHFAQLKAKYLSETPLRIHNNPESGTTVTIGQRTFTAEELKHLAQTSTIDTISKEQLREKLSAIHENMAIVAAGKKAGLLTQPDSLAEKLRMEAIKIQAETQLNQLLNQKGYEPTEQQLQTYYQERGNQYRSIQRFKMHTLIIPFDDDRPKALQLANAIADKARNGLASLQSLKSQYPGLTYHDGNRFDNGISQHRLFWIDTDLIRALDSIKPEEVVVVETEKDGIWIMQLLKSIPPRIPPLEDIKDQVAADWINAEKAKDVQRMEQSMFQRFLDQDL